MRGPRGGFFELTCFSHQAAESQKGKSPERDSGPPVAYTQRCKVSPDVRGER
jgi:hypothetical protein